VLTSHNLDALAALLPRFAALLPLMLHSGLASELPSIIASLYEHIGRLSDSGGEWTATKATMIACVHSTSIYAAVEAAVGGRAFIAVLLPVLLDALRLRSRPTVTLASEALLSWGLAQSPYIAAKMLLLPVVHVAARPRPHPDLSVKLLSALGTLSRYFIFFSCWRLIALSLQVDKLGASLAEAFALMPMLTLVNQHCKRLLTGPSSTALESLAEVVSSLHGALAAAVPSAHLNLSLSNSALVKDSAAFFDSPELARRWASLISLWASAISDTKSKNVLWLLLQSLFDRPSPSNAEREALTILRPLAPQHAHSLGKATGDGDMPLDFLVTGANGVVPGESLTGNLSHPLQSLPPSFTDARASMADESGVEVLSSSWLSAVPGLKPRGAHLETSTNCFAHSSVISPCDSFY